MYSSTVENYLKAILMSGEQNAGDTTPSDIVATGALAVALDVAPGTVTTMVKSLAEQGLLVHLPREGVRLTKTGHLAAARVLRKHRLVETFLVAALKMDWAEVHEEAETLEHAISERVLQRIDTMLGHPVTDPHGDPIPDAQGRMPDAANATRHTLATCPQKMLWHIARIHDQAPTFLEFAQKRGLKPGAYVRVLERNQTAGVILCEVKGTGKTTLGLGEAAKIDVTK